MQKEYVFYDTVGIDFPLDEAIELVKSPVDGDFLVSNHPDVQAVIYAPEINFYLEKSHDSIAKKITNLTKLYAIRSVGFDFAQDVDYTQDVGKKLLIVTDDKAHEALKSTLLEEGYTVMLLSPSMILDVNGHIGSLHVTLK